MKPKPGTASDCKLFKSAANVSKGSTNMLKSTKTWKNQRITMGRLGSLPSLRLQASLKKQNVSKGNANGLKSTPMEPMKAKPGTPGNLPNPQTVSFLKSSEMFQKSPPEGWEEEETSGECTKGVNLWYFSTNVYDSTNIDIPTNIYYNFTIDATPWWNLLNNGFHKTVRGTTECTRSQNALYSACYTLSYIDKGT